jgi:ubiquinone biosynthesis UbiH/UbiF/VisC/COQ6 family hydroxylase
MMGQLDSDQPVFEYDVAIVGAGMVGAALALHLASLTSLNVCLLERAQMLEDSLPPNRRVVALGRQAIDLLSELNVFQDLTMEQAFPYQAMHVWDASSHGELRFSAKDADQPCLGYMVDALRCNYLLQQQCLAAPGISVHFETTLHQLQSGRRFARLDTDFGQIRARLVVAADGAHSWVRRQSKIFTNQHDYQQAGIVTRVVSERSHEGCAWQRFLETGPIAFLPLANNECSIVWSVDNAALEPLMQCSEKDFVDQLTAAIDARLGTLELLDQRVAFPLRSQRAEQYYTKRVVLVGDAAHSIHPLAGQGVNLGLQDVLALARSLSSVPIEEVASATTLAQYQRRRKPANEQVDRAMSLLRSAYQGQTATVWNTLRGVGMNAISRSPLMRRMLVRQALGV